MNSSTILPSPPLTNRTVLKHLVLLFLLGTTLWLATCGLWDLRGPDEGRYVQVAKELLTRSNWFHLTVNGETYDQKPPLQFWFIAESLHMFRSFGLSWASRLPAIAMAIATVLLTYCLGFHAGGRSPSAGLASALVLLTMPLYTENVPQAELNVPYTFWITLAIVAWYPNRAEAKLVWSRVAMLWMAVAAAFFTKGPLAILIVMLVIGGEALLGRTWRPVRCTRPILGSAILALLIGGWLFAESRIAGDAFVANQVRGETVRRIFSGSHGQPFWYYLPRIFTVLFPWSIVLAFACAAFWKGQPRAGAGTLRPFVLWATLPFLVLCIAHGKRQSYLLPLLPPLAVIAGVYVSRLDFGFLSRRAKWFSLTLFVGFLFMSLLLGAGTVVALLAPQVFTRYQIVLVPWAPWIWLTGALVAAGAAVWFACSKTATFSRSPFLGGVTAVILVFGIRFTSIEPSLDSRKSTRSFAVSVENLGIGRLGALREAGIPEYHVYGNYTVDQVGARDLISTPLRTDVLAVDTNDSDRFTTALATRGFEMWKRIAAGKDHLNLFRRTHTPVEPDRDRSVTQFALLGDTGLDNPRAHHVTERILEKARTEKIDAVFLLGDNVYEGDLETSADEKIRRPLAGVHEAHLPVYAALGNHDYQKSRWTHELASQNLGMGGFRYYARTFGKDLVTFFVLDSETLCEGRDDPAQIEWLRQEITNCESVWKVLLLHRPLLAGKELHAAEDQLYRRLLPVLNGPHGDIDIVVSGHNHIYDRRNVGNDGILHITTGSGGKLSDDVPLESDPDRAVAYNKQGVVLFMRAMRDRLILEAVDESGEVVDLAKVSDHENPGAADRVEVAAIQMP